MRHLYPFRFDRLASKRRTPASNRQLGVVLAFIAGYINAGGFFIVRHYTSHMTGILSEAAGMFSVGQFTIAVSMLIFISCFVGGAMATTLLVLHARRRSTHSQFSLPLISEGVLLILVLVLGTNTASHAERIPIIIALLCFLMGVQNALITKASTAIVRTTHVTGMTTDLGIELGRLLSGQEQNSRTQSLQKISLFLMIICTFLIGGIMGALAINRFGAAGLWPVIGILFLISLPPLLQDIRVYRAIKSRRRRKEQHA